MPPGVAPVLTAPPAPQPFVYEEPVRDITKVVLAIAAAVAVIAGGTFFALQAGDGEKEAKAAVTVPTSHTITGTMTLIDSSGWTSGEECYGTGGYDDIGEGSSVTIRDGRDAIIATGSLGGGTGGEAYLDDSTVSCNLSFSVADVPDVDFYQIEVSHRGALSYSKADMVSKGWSVDLSLS